MSTSWFAVMLFSSGQSSINAANKKARQLTHSSQALHALAEHCNFGTLTDEMIRDRIVVGLLDAKLSEKLQLDPELTLPKAVNQARQSEAVKKTTNPNAK